MKNQTAVDMFCLSITDHIEGIFNGSIQQDEFAKRMRKSYNQAKSIEKDKIESAYLKGYNDCSLGRFSDCEKYYNETFL